MKTNRVEFKRRENISSFLARYGTNDQCETALFQTRWPDGYRCPECGGHDYCYLRKNHLYQCNRCHHQTSETAGTIFEATKLPLKTWFLGIYLITQSKDGISSLSLARHLGISKNSAWLLKHKLLQVMLEHENQQLLTERDELYDAYSGGEYHGGKYGRGASGKHLPRYLAEFNYRFNRRFDLNQLVEKLLFDSTRTPPMPQKLIKLAEVA